MPDRALQQPPAGVPDEADPQQRKQNLTERLALDGGQRAVLVGPRRTPNSHVEDQQPDDRPHHRAADQSEPGQVVDLVALLGLARLTFQHLAASP